MQSISTAPYSETSRRQYSCGAAAAGPALPKNAVQAIAVALKLKSFFMFALPGLFASAERCFHRHNRCDQGRYGCIRLLIMRATLEGLSNKSRRSATGKGFA
jgi:hypothetical protein